MFSAADALRLLQREIVAVVGCTEPATIAFAVASARRFLRPRAGAALTVELWLSREVRRNGSTAVVPAVNRRGLVYAAAAGLVTCSRGYNPFAALDARRVRAVVRRRHWLTVHTAPQCGVYARARVSDGHNWAEATVQGGHDQLALLSDSRGLGQQCTRPHLKLPAGIPDIIRVAEQREARLERFVRTFLREQAAVRLPVDRAVPHLVRARMLGGAFRVMTITGSGNQGMFIGVPLRELLRQRGEAALPAAVVALLTQCWLTRRRKRISDSCGLATKAAPALAAGLAYAAGGGSRALATALRVVPRHLDGMRCPGALPSCGRKAQQALRAVRAAVRA